MRQQTWEGLPMRSLSAVMPPGRPGSEQSDLVRLRPPHSLMTKADGGKRRTR
jgi:hypothetical protein